MNRIPNLVLIGFMGTGKSSVGRRCAAELGYPYHDTDMWVVRRAHQSIPAIFSTEGEPAFRALEKDAVRALSQRSAIVLSTGGGAVLDRENAALLRESGVVVLLTAAPEAILARVGGRGGRPLLESEDPEQRVRGLLQAREPAYRAAAHATIDTTCLSRDDVVREALSIYRSRL